MLSDDAIRSQVQRVLDHQLDLEDFEDWLVSQSWDIHKNSSGPAVRLAFAIELRLAEHAQGHLDRRELFRELSELIQAGAAATSTTTSSSASILQQSMAVSFSVFPVRGTGVSLPSGELGDLRVTLVA